MLKLRQDVVSSRNRWLVGVFLAYVLLIACFALIYYWLYRENPHAFAFNGDIAGAQRAATELIIASSLNGARSDCNQVRRELSILRLWQQDLEETRGEPAYGGNASSGLLTCTVRGRHGTYKVVWHRYFSGGGTGIAAVEDKLTIEFGNYTIEGKPGYTFPRTMKETKTLCSNWATDWEKERNRLDHVLDSLQTNAPETWSFPDFLYFSAITQATVGYGDILPNSTSVRLIVVIQTLAAAAMVVVVANLAFRRT